MRSETEIKDVITDFAINDSRVRAVLLNGSRANPKIKADKLQDFDVVFIVKNIDSFTSDHNWTSFLGEKLIWQLPDEMTFIKDPSDNKKTNSFSYLMLFRDYNRVDLTLFPIESFRTEFVIDSLTIVWLDKDLLFPNVLTSSDADYFTKKPTEKEFLETSNEFCWVSAYVAKGLVRNEIIYAKEMLETVVRPMLMKIVTWKIGAENDFSVSVGKSAKFASQYLSEDFYAKLLQTYCNAEIENNWKSLLIMTKLFEQASAELSLKLKFKHDKAELQNTINYLNYLCDQQKKPTLIQREK